MLHIFPLFAVISGIFFTVLNGIVILARRRHGIAFGDQGHGTLIRAKSAYHNFIEFTVMFLLLCLAVERTGGSGWGLLGLGGVFFVARLIHIQAMLQHDLRLRVLSIASSHTVNLCLMIWTLLNLWPA